jgi:hypothetical protein
MQIKAGDAARNTLPLVMHRLSRPHRSLTAFLAVLALLWSQLALAAYVCPGTGEAPGTPTMAERMATGEPCDGVADAGDAGQPTLCHQHCADAPQSADTAQLPVPSLPALVQAWPAPLRAATPVTGAEPPASRAAEAAPRPPPNPLFLSTLRLRV